MYTTNSNIFNLNTPSTIVPTPTKLDYEDGFLIRYFVRKANDVNGFIFEVSQETFELYLENPYWVCGELKWRIAGPVEPVYKSNGELDDMGVRKSNKTSINFTAKSLPNIGLYLPNLLQFYK
jgi:hypothetical protein